jgi:hypothetical protein
MRKELPGKRGEGGPLPDSSLRGSSLDKSKVPQAITEPHIYSLEAHLTKSTLSSSLLYLFPRG